ncbi:hypothetical protein Tsubulata_008090 [Turnera subulata]|uniref:Methyltransferase-related protein n=1 Tax=Turnera subulata TaxID=218843 RepID=A0A9Q0J5N3_9ROSI|nr:hypothetical protein Tsubulata_008090 [Turnera subulata]
MCPLRVILIFLSATLAGFFLVRNLKSFSSSSVADDGDDVTDTASGDLVNGKNTPHGAHPDLFSKVKGGVESGFWMFVDMASGKYLWRHLVSSAPASSNRKSKKLE